MSHKVLFIGGPWDGMWREFTSPPPLIERAFKVLASDNWEEPAIGRLMPLVAESFGYRRQIVRTTDGDVSVYLPNGDERDAVAVLLAAYRPQSTASGA